MIIERKAEEYGLPAGIIRIKLTSEEISQAHRIKEKEYITLDIQNQIQSAYENENISEDDMDKMCENESVIEKIIEWYDKSCSCNEPYNSTIEEAVKEVLKEEGVEWI